MSKSSEIIAAKSFEALFTVYYRLNFSSNHLRIGKTKYRKG